MKTIFLMLGFFTKLPVPHVPYSDERYARGLKTVPFVGLLVGLLLYGISFLSLLFERPVTAFILTVSYVLLTGAIHLDGMSDSSDGLFSGRDRDKILEIMQDSRVGAYGVMSLILWFAFMLIFLSYLPYEALIIMPLVGKSASIVSGYLGHYARKDGLGRVFTENCGIKEVLISFIVPLSVIIIIVNIPEAHYIYGFIFALSAVLSILYAAIFTHGLNGVIGGVTGDTLGFVCETAQVGFLALTYVFIRLLC